MSKEDCGFSERSELDFIKQQTPGLVITRCSSKAQSDETIIDTMGQHLLNFMYEGDISGEKSIESGPWRSWTFRTNDWFFGPAHQNGSITRWTQQEDSSEISIVTFHLDPGLLVKHAHEAADKTPLEIELLPRPTFADPFLLELGRTLHETANSSVQTKSPANSDNMYEQTTAHLLCIYLLKTYCSITFKIPEYKEKHPPLRITLEYIDNHPTQDLSLEKLASMADMSVYHFIRLFKKTVGMTPHQYVINRRVDMAKKLLKDSNMSISEIASQFGYNISHFTQFFRRAMGCTPKQFRQNHRTLFFSK